MLDRLEMLLEDFQGLVDLHDEYAELVEPDDIEMRRLWEEIQTRMSTLTKSVARLRRRGSDEGDLFDEVELEIEELNDSYGDLAALV